MLAAMKRRALLRGLLTGLAWVACPCRPASAAVPVNARRRLEQLLRLPEARLEVGLQYHPFLGPRLKPPVVPPDLDPEELARQVAEHPQDPRLLLRWGVYCQLRLQPRTARQALTRAVEAFHQQGIEDAADPDRWLDYAGALRDLGQIAEAERALRRARDLAPEPWRPTLPLARLLSGRAVMTVVAGADPLAPDLLALPAAAGPDAPPGPDQADRARRWQTEAETLLAAAQPPQAAPAEFYQSRALLAANRRWLEARLGTLESARPGDRRFLLALFHPDPRADLHRAAEQEPEDAAAWGRLALAEALGVGLLAGQPSPAECLRPELWREWPDASRTVLREALHRLDLLAEDPRPRRAALALGLAGLLQFFLVGNRTGGLSALRRAVVLDPANDLAWEVLTFALQELREAAERLAACRQRLAQHDSPRHRLLLARALEQQGQLETMLETAVAAQQRFGDNALANLTLAAAFLRTHRTETGRVLAQVYLSRAARHAGESPPPALAAELHFQRGLWFALSDQPASARREFQQMLELAPRHPEALEALRALDQAGE